VGEFRFNIGDLIAMRGAFETSKIQMKISRLSESSVPVCVTIIERIRQECPAGEQLHYGVRTDSGIKWVSEVDVCSWSEVEQWGRNAREAHR